VNLGEQKMDKAELSVIGIVEWFNNKKGFGFIRKDDVDYFVHYKSIQSRGFKTLREGQNVKFTPQQTERGMVANDVYVLNS